MRMMRMKMKSTLTITVMMMMMMMMMMMLGKNHGGGVMGQATERSSAEIEADRGCRCTPTGFSGRTNTGFIGCRPHYASQGDDRFFCYVEDPRTCFETAFSQRFPGATYRFCEPPPPPATVLQVIQDIGALSTLNAVLEFTGLDAALKNTAAEDGTGLTVFAPSNVAFQRAAEALGAESPADLLTEENIDLLTSVLLFHVAPQIVSSLSVIDAGGALKVPTLSDASFNDLRTVAEEFDSRFRSYQNRLTSSDLDPTKLISFAIEERIFATSNAFGAHVLRGDIEAGNGIVQIIDSVLRPPEDIASIAARVPRLRTFLEALEAASLVETFTCTNGECPAKPVTVFAPTNAAFKTLLEELGISQTELFENVDLLTSVLLYHVSDPAQLTEPLLVQEIANGAEVPNLLGSSLQGGVASLQEDVTTRDGGSIVISTRSVPKISGEVNDAKIVAAANVGAFNGVVHLIDNVLIPPPVFEEEDVELVDTPLEDDATPDELSLFDVISDDERLSILSAALSVPAADSLRLALEEVTPEFEATIFAPTDEAFEALAGELGIELEEILAAPFLLETLLYHASLGRVTSDAFSEEPLAIDTGTKMPPCCVTIRIPDHCDFESWNLCVHTHAIVGVLFSHRACLMDKLTCTHTHTLTHTHTHTHTRTVCTCCCCCGAT